MTSRESGHGQPTHEGDQETKIFKNNINKRAMLWSLGNVLKTKCQKVQEMLILVILITWAKVTNKNVKETIDHTYFI